MHTFCSLILVTTIACGAGDQTIDITHDPCTAIVVEAPDATPAQAARIAEGVALWNARGAPRLTTIPSPERVAIALRFESASTAFRGHYDDEAGVILINGSLTGEQLAIVVAHEVGHAFGLPHVSGRTSLMNRGNIVTPPTDGDQSALEAMWGACDAR